MIDYKIIVTKILSRNDTGETNSHQSGISIPKRIASTEIFPKLGIDKLNPRVEMVFEDEEGQTYTFQYIYYNDVFFRSDKKRGHNEYRITRVKDFISRYGLTAGDQIWLAIDNYNNRIIGYEKANTVKKDSAQNVIKISGGWKCIKY